jgi:hypothetical protein
VSFIGKTYLVDPNQGEWRLLYPAKEIWNAIWSPDSERFFYSEVNPYNNTLVHFVVHEADGSQTWDLGEFSYMDVMGEPSWGRCGGLVANLRKY